MTSTGCGCCLRGAVAHRGSCLCELLLQALLLLLEFEDTKLLLQLVALLGESDLLRVLLVRLHLRPLRVLELARDRRVGDGTALGTVSACHGGISLGGISLGGINLGGISLGGISRGGISLLRIMRLARKQREENFALVVLVEITTLHRLGERVALRAITAGLTVHLGGVHSYVRNVEIERGTYD